MTSHDVSTHNTEPKRRGLRGEAYNTMQIKRSRRITLHIRFIHYPRHRPNIPTMFTRSTFLPLLTSLLTNSAAAAAIWNVGQSVKTSSGTVYGHAAPNRTQVSEYLAIPFAQPPIGNLRFNAPQSYNNTNASINSSTYPLNCPQNPVSLPGLTADQYTTQLIEYLQGTGSGSSGLYSEDCLYLNVWTKPQTGDAKKAVMMWFFPGGFRAGGTDNVGTNGQYYADLHDVSSCKCTT